MDNQSSNPGRQSSNPGRQSSNSGWDDLARQLGAAPNEPASPAEEPAPSASESPEAETEVSFADGAAELSADPEDELIAQEVSEPAEQCAPPESLTDDRSPAADPESLALDDPVLEEEADTETSEAAPESLDASFGIGLLEELELPPTEQATTTDPEPAPLPFQPRQVSSADSTDSKGGWDSLYSKIGMPAPEPATPAPAPVEEETRAGDAADGEISAPPPHDAPLEQGLSRKDQSEPEQSEPEIEENVTAEADGSEASDDQLDPWAEAGKQVGATPSTPEASDAANGGGAVTAAVSLWQSIFGAPKVEPPASNTRGQDSIDSDSDAGDESEQHPAGSTSAAVSSADSTDGDGGIPSFLKEDADLTAPAAGSDPEKQRRRRRGGRGRGRSDETTEVDSGTEETKVESRHEHEDGGSDEEADRPRRRRRRRRRGGEEPAATEEPSKSDRGERGDQGEEDEDRKPTRRRRGRRRSSRDADDPTVADGTRSAPDWDSDDDIADSTGDSDDDASDDESREKPRKKLANVPTWHETVGVIVEANLESRSSRSTSRSGGGGGRRRGGGGRGRRNSRDN